jgi:hypothetical protein
MWNSSFTDEDYKKYNHLMSDPLRCKLYVQAYSGDRVAMHALIDWYEDQGVSRAYMLPTNSNT